MSKVCNHCGAVQEDSAKFCEECGSRLLDAVNPVLIDAGTGEIEVIEACAGGYESAGADAREVRERLVGEKSEYYLPRFEQMETLHSVTGWNWCAFLFGASWMMYRKMYAFAVAFAVVTQLLGLLHLGFVSLVLWIGSGVVGNYLYMRDINARTEKAMNMQPAQREAYIQKYSGTSWVAVIVLILISSALGILLL